MIRLLRHTSEFPGAMSDARGHDITWHIAQKHWAYASKFRLFHIAQIRDLALMEQQRGNTRAANETLKHIHPLN